MRLWWHYASWCWNCDSVSEKPTVILGDCVVHAAKTVRNLGVLPDSHLDGDVHISSIVRLCNFHLYQLARVRCCISDEACHLAVHACPSCLKARLLQHTPCWSLPASAWRTTVAPEPCCQIGGMSTHPARRSCACHPYPAATALASCTPVSSLKSLCTCSPLCACIYMVWVLPTCQNCYSTTSGTATSADVLQRSSDNTNPDGELVEWALGWHGPRSGQVSRSLYERLALSLTSRLV